MYINVKQIIQNVVIYNYCIIFEDVNSAYTSISIY